MGIFDSILGRGNKEHVIMRDVSRVSELEEEYKQLTDEKLKEKTSEFKKSIKDGGSIDDIWGEAFAVIREAGKRTLGQRHYDVQLMGGLTLHEGKIAEMKTGEGKTLMETLPVYLNALEGKGVHVITVNDYLAKRDADWMGSIYNFLGLSVGCIQHLESFMYDQEEKGEYHLRKVTKREAYAADITYGTNNEFGFDYLRDHMAQNTEDKVQRGLNFAIIDEVDSILIDEARTPLIISAPAEESAKQYYEFADMVTKLKEDEDYNVDEKMKAATLTEAGITKMEKMLGVDNIYTSGGIRTVHHMEQALKARTLCRKDKEYVVKEDQLIIVDEFTGRLMPGRRFSEGLHQALEAKEKLTIQRESMTLASITFQNYFKMYDKISGMTGTAHTEQEEFHKIYNLDVVQIPTNRPFVRNDRNDLIYKTEKAKLKAVINEIKERHEKGQPVLIGTISIEKNEVLSDLLTKARIPFKMLNAKQHEQEAKIIAQAGTKGSVTVATNMAGRGVDVILGGAPFEQKKFDEVKELGGLMVIGTERHESRRIDNQLRGRAGRQGDPGESLFFISLDDDLMRIFAGDSMKSMMERLKIPDDMPIENKVVSRSIESAQKKVEGHNFDIRKHLVEYDNIINKHRDVIYKKRDDILYNFKNEPKANSKMVLDDIHDEIESVVSFHTSAEKSKDWNLKEIWQSIRTIFLFDAVSELKLAQIEKGAEDRFDLVKQRTYLIDYLQGMAKSRYDELVEKVNTTMKDDVVSDIPLMHHLEKAVLLRSIDTLWVEHLEAIGYLRTGIGLRGYGQRDPLIEYKKESYKLFMELLGLISKQTAQTIFKVANVPQFAPSIMQQKQTYTAPSKTMEGKGSNIEKSAQQEQVESREIKDTVPGKLKNEEGVKIGRNDMCPCGSGLKYKKCGLIGATEHKG